MQYPISAHLYPGEADKSILMGNWQRGPNENADRGVSNVLGVILVVSVVLIGVVATVGFGVTGLAGSTTELSDTAVERDLIGLATTVDATTVYSGMNPEQARIDLATAEVAGNSDHLRLDGTAGTLALAIRTDSGERSLLRTSLGLLEYEDPQSDARIAYQSGLVFSAPTATETPGVVRRNVFEHRIDRGVHGVTLHVTHLLGRESLGDAVTVRATNRRSVYQPGKLNGTDDLVLRITSTYSDSWALALRDVFPAERTTITTGSGPDELVLTYDVPDDGAFLQAVLHEVTLDD